MSDQKTFFLTRRRRRLFAMFADAMGYAIDAAQRTILFWNVML